MFILHILCVHLDHLVVTSQSQLLPSNHQSNTIKLIKDLSLAMLIFVTIIIIELVFYRLTLIRTISFFWHCFGLCWSSSHRSGTRDGLFSKTSKRRRNTTADLGILFSAGYRLFFVFLPYFCGLWRKNSSSWLLDCLQPSVALPHHPFFPLSSKNWFSSIILINLVTFCMQLNYS